MEHVLAETLGPLPHYLQLFNFLPESEHQMLLDWTLANEALFKPAKVTKGRKDSQSRLDPQKRIALITGKFASLKPMLRPRFLSVLDKVMVGTGAQGPTPGSLELQLAAHGDGAHFAPHLDIPVGPDRKSLGSSPSEDRVISAVYYFYAEPKAFSGGNLRLYRFGADPEGCGAETANHIDVEPVRNSLVAFPSWALHEVRRVSCPTGDFGDYRFALNCWYCRALGPPHELGSGG